MRIPKSNSVSRSLCIQLWIYCQVIHIHRREYRTKPTNSISPNQLYRNIGNKNEWMLTFCKHLSNWRREQWYFQQNSCLYMVFECPHTLTHTYTKVMRVYKSGNVKYVLVRTMKIICINMFVVKLILCRILLFDIFDDGEKFLRMKLDKIMMRGNYVFLVNSNFKEKCWNIVNIWKVYDDIMKQVIAIWHQDMSAMSLFMSLWLIFQ